MSEAGCSAPAPDFLDLGAVLLPWGVLGCCLGAKAVPVLAVFSAICFRGGIPPVDLRAVCLVRATTAQLKPRAGTRQAKVADAVASSLVML